MKHGKEQIVTKFRKVASLLMQCSLVMQQKLALHTLADAADCPKMSLFLYWKACFIFYASLAPAIEENP